MTEIPGQYETGVPAPEPGIPAIVQELSKHVGLTPSQWWPESNGGWGILFTTGQKMHFEREPEPIVRPVVATHHEIQRRGGSEARPRSPKSRKKA